MIAKVYSAIPQGYNGRIVEVEGDTNQGLPCFNIVGMANKTIFESRERVRSAMANSNFSFPKRKLTINLAPAELAKDGSHLDLPIALAVLVLSQQLLQSDLTGRLFVGELSLNGTTKPVRGIINIVETAKKLGYREVFIPVDNLKTAKIVSGINIIGVKNLIELVLHLRGLKIIQPQKCVQANSAPVSSTVVKNNCTDEPCLDAIQGQTLAKRALLIAVAGRHNLLLSGPPGAGKTMLARVARSLLPPPSPQEQLEIAKLGSLLSPTQPSLERPFRAPHHTASQIAMIGGGAKAIPGEISLAHHGVLFLDEFPEYSRIVIESLRQPLEDGHISLARAKEHVTYPANFLLIATMNPCPCGYLGNRHHACTCTEQQINAYHKRISGPIFDRIDICLDVQPVSSKALITSISKNVVKNTKTDTNKLLSEHATAKKLIQNAIKAQEKRYRGMNLYNGSLSSRQVLDYLKIRPDAINFLQTAIDKLQLSARSYFKIIKVAQTIADLDSAPEVMTEHISEALSFRKHKP